MTRWRLMASIEQMMNHDAIFMKDALRAVVGLHKPQDITLPNGDWGTNCTQCDGWEYPCPTIQAIEKELK